MSFRLASEDAELLQAAKGNILLRVWWRNFYDDKMATMEMSVEQ
jgi:hypothetical protein